MFRTALSQVYRSPSVMTRLPAVRSAAFARRQYSDKPADEASPKAEEAKAGEAKA
ncbi:hypothetical protein EC988_001269, partial [Linderina pennispora]